MNVFFRSNLLLDLPSSMAFHPKLAVLLLDHNLFINLPSLLSSLPSLKTLTTRGNILSSPPANIIDKGIQAVKQWLNKEVIDLVLGVISTFLDTVFGHSGLITRKAQQIQRQNQFCYTSKQDFNSDFLNP